MIEELEELKDVAYNLEYRNKFLEKELNNAKEIIEELDEECRTLDNILFFTKWLYIITLIFVIVNTF